MMFYDNIHDVVAKVFLKNFISSYIRETYPAPFYLHFIFKDCK